MSSEALTHQVHQFIQNFGLLQSAFVGGYIVPAQQIQAFSTCTGLHLALLLTEYTSESTAARILTGYFQSSCYFCQPVNCQIRQTLEEGVILDVGKPLDTSHPTSLAMCSPAPISMNMPPIAMHTFSSTSCRHRWSP